MRLGLDQAKVLHEKNNTPQNVLEHCLTVSVYAREIADKIRKAGHKVDADFVESAAYLHDIGRSATHGIRHGIEGAEILRDYPEYARVCARHIGGGISSAEAKELGLPEGDYIPETLEEKIVCYADKLVSGTERITLEDAVAKFSKRLGRDHKTIGRIRELDTYIRSLGG